MLVLHTLTLFSIIGSMGVKAAQCCAYRGDMNESKLWEAREKFCSAPTSAEKVDNGYQYKVDVSLDWANTEYIFWGRADNDDFSHCWDATAEIIEQCARNNQGVGSWQLGGEQYAMSASSISYRRKREVLSPLPDLIVSSLTDENGGFAYDMPSDSQLSQLTDGVYEVDGHPVELHFSGLDFGRHQTRDLTTGKGMLDTSKGPVSNWTVGHRNTVNLKDAITRAVRSTHSTPRALAKRGQKCDVGRFDYVMVEIGDWKTEYEPVSNTIQTCGGPSKCKVQRSSSVTWTESFNVGLDSAASKGPASAALSLGYGWSKSFTNEESYECEWSEGKCHIWFTAAYYTWQRGFQIETTPLGDGQQTIASVRLIHGDAPTGKADDQCGLSCCHDKAYRPHPSWCSEATPENKDYYGTCNDPTKKIDDYCGHPESKWD